MKTSLFLYFLSEVFLSFGIGIVQYAMPFYYASAGIGDEKIGYLIAINALFGGCSALIVGPIADRVGASHMFKLGTLLIGVGDLGLCTFHAYPVWMVMSALSGVGGSTLTSTENVVLSSLLAGHERTNLISRFTALYMLLIGGGIVCAGFLVNWYGLLATMWIGTLVALVAPFIRIFVKAPDSRRDRVFGWPARPLILMAFYAILFGIAGGLFNPFATLILESRYHATTTVTSVVYAIGIFMISFGSFLVRPLIRRLKEQATLFVSFLLSALSTLLFLLATSTALFVGTYFLMTAASAVPPPVIDAMFLNFVHSSEFSQMFGMRVFGTRVGNAIGSSIGGALLKGDKLAWVMILSAAFFVFSYVYLVIVRRPLLRKYREKEPQSVS